MDIFVITHYHECADYYYGYQEKLYMIFETYEEAKENVDITLRENATLYDNSCPGGSYIQILHLFSFKTPIFIGKNKKKCKINSRNFTYDGLTFSCSAFLEQVKDEI